MARPKHHIVPVTYLRHFADSTGKLYALNREDLYRPGIQTVTPGSKMFWSRNYYATENSENPQTIEFFFARDIEPTYNTLISIISKERPISDWETKLLFLQWLFYAKRRSPLWRILMEDQFNELSSRDNPGIDEETLQLIRNNIAKATKQAHIDLFLKEPLLRGDMEHFVSNVLAKKWEVLKAPPSHCWWTSDNPGCGVQLDGPTTIEGSKANPLWELLDADSLLYFPLTAEYTLCIFPYEQGRDPKSNLTNQDIGFRIADPAEVRWVNYWTACTQHRLIISSTRESLKEIEAIHLNERNGTNA
ncbi:MAG: DUF4238 domain-containing protein [Flavobacteriales bacterium]|nr:DUF4238 domain-containing protein [Flavobacteriales bacterium]